MDSWNYGCDGKGFVMSDEMISSTGALPRSGTVMGWDLRSPFNIENARLESSAEVDENLGFRELGFSDMARKPLSDHLFGVVLDSRMIGSNVSSPSCMSNSKEFSQEDSSSRFSSSVADSSVSDSSLFIDLKLGRLNDYQDIQIGKSSKGKPSILPTVFTVPEKRRLDDHQDIQIDKSSIEKPSISTVVFTTPVKRARTTAFTYQAPVCQIDGCNVNLSNSKDYHKRHRICDVHSKTDKVTVDGIEQRFCQQCSKFHLLAEFDDGKRSCRKRLAGHNARRRKPQVDSQTSRNGELHLPYYGNRSEESSLSARTSFTNPSMFQSGINEEFYSPYSLAPATYPNLLLKSSLPPFGATKQYPFSPELDFLPSSASSGSENLTIYDTTSTIQGLSGVSDSDSALSLLSFQSQNLSTHSSEIPFDHYLPIQGNQAPYNLDQFSSSQASTSLDESDFLGAYDASNSFDFDLHNDRLPHEHTPTVDLLQLSSQLQCVGHQRRSFQDTQKTDTFSFLHIT